MKTCTKCKKLLSDDQFSEDRTSKDGLNHRCEPCVKAYGQGYPTRAQWEAAFSGQKNTEKELAEKYAAYYRAHVEEMTFFSMTQRCNNPEHYQYKNYGGRGIKMLYKDFKEFIDDVGLRPSDEYSIDRINNGGNYEIGNCKWATVKEQIKEK